MTNALGSLTEAIGPHLLAVERRFHDELASDLSCVNTLVKHVSRFRGKMLRPSLVLLAARATGDITDAHITIATVVEMVHMATLVHDDVLDEAELRRKGATINHLKGNEAAVLLGDFLISHSYHLCSSLESQYASRLIGHTTNQVCEGELLQNDNRGNYDLDEQTYLKIIGRKTASLCAACCNLGAWRNNAPPDQIAALETYGMSLGIAFQIQDDVLDIVGDVDTVGKTLGLDVDKGKMTLPLIHFIRTAPVEHRVLLRSLLTGNDPDKAEQIRNLIIPSRSIAFAHDRARQLVEKARSAIKVLPKSDARQTLDVMADLVVNRPM
jgi:octaprenyl-diphosphate synthase